MGSNVSKPKDKPTIYENPGDNTTSNSMNCSSDATRISPIPKSGECADPAYIQMPEEGKFIEDGPARTPMFVKPFPTTLTKYRTMELGEDISCLWRTPLVNKVVCGSRVTGSLWVVDENCDITKYSLKHGKAIKSGTCVSTEISMIHVETREQPVVYTINLNTTSNDSNSLVPVGVFKVSNPLRVFRFDTYKYGVLCKEPSRIEIFKLRDILLETAITTTQTVQIDLPYLDVFDTLCMDPHGTFYVTSYRRNSVLMNNAQGEQIGKAGITRGKNDPAAPGGIYHPVSVQCDIKGKLIVCCDDGDIHMFDGHNWSILKDEGGWIWDSVVTDDLLWLVCEDKLTLWSK